MEPGSTLVEQADLERVVSQFDQWGAAASNAILLLGEYFIHEALGSQWAQFPQLPAHSID